MTAIFTGPDDQSGSDSGHRRADGGHGTLERRERRWGLLFVTPWLLGLVLLFIAPLVLSLLMSFTNYELIDTDDQDIAWVGLDNWQRVFDDPEVGNGLLVTLKFAVMFVPVSTLLPLAVAYLLTSERLWGRSIFRLLFYLPSMVPLVAAMIIWRFYLNAESGWFARLLRWIGLDPPNFLG
ncbi:MAG: sugar ABC transporter permease, partial [Actinomycetota bacterium]